MMSDTNTPVIKIVVPLYYCHPKLYLIIDKFFKSLNHYSDFDLVVIDDASPLPMPPTWPKMIRNSKNLGYTKTVNKGLEIAFWSADICIVANDDLEFKVGDLDRFKEIKDGIYSPADSASGDLETFGAIWGMNKATFEKMGKLNEKFKHYYSDQDYFNRAKQLDVPVVKWRDIIVKHHESATYNLLDKEKLLKEDAMRIE